MHPFCCVSSVTDHSPVKPVPPDITMPPPATTMTAATRSESTRSAALVHNQTNNHHGNSADLNRPSQRNKAAVREAAPPPADAKISDLVGIGISGVLYKWVNYGKGWRPRWFVLQDGVLSYYKIHGPDKIVVNQETEKGCKVIGEDSMRIISGHKNSHSNFHPQRKPSVKSTSRFRRSERADQTTGGFRYSQEPRGFTCELKLGRIVWLVDALKSREEGSPDFIL